MKNTSSGHRRDDLRKEYTLDYSRSKPNRFAGKLKDTMAVVLQPDVAEVFQSAEAVNDLLRSAINAAGGGLVKGHRIVRAEKQPARHSG